MGGICYTTYFECKQYAQHKPVGAKVVRELYGVMNRDRIDKAVIVTTSYFTRGAIAEANRLNGRIKLIDYNELQRLMR
jgi:restriction endonuclease Mrr